MRVLTRREFMHDSAAVAAALAGAAAVLDPVQLIAADPPTPKNANDRLNVAVIGVHGRGMSHVHGFSGKNNCQVTTVCDCDSGVIKGALNYVEKTQGKAPTFVQDLRKVMDDKSIDIVSIATPNHWHALAAIWALQAGKHVYVEKPVSHNVSEGRRIVEASRKYNRLCQAGTQSRSNPGMRQSIEYVHSGKIGKVTLSRGLCYKSRPSIGKTTGDQKPPETMNFDLWCGPAPLLPPHRNSKKYGTVHYDWHWIWDYGNGDLGNQGIHEMDKARWGLNKMELPRGVVSVGGRVGYEDDGETANTQLCVFDYGDAELIFEVRGLPTSKLQGVSVGNIFYGSDGYVVCPSYNSGVVYTPKGEVVTKFQGGGDQLHFDNFIQAVRAGKREMLNGEILEGHLSSALCHLGNISYRLGKVGPFAAQKEALGSDKQALEALTRMEEHLKENKVSLEEAKYHVGRRLQIDPKTERFINDPEADKYLTRPYRAPYIVPEKI